MNKLVKIFTVLAVLVLLTMPALGVYDAKNDHTVIRAPKVEKPVANLLVLPVDGNIGFITSAQLYSTVILIDTSTGGQALWKKWYVDGKIISRSTAGRVDYYISDNTGNHKFTLRAANRAGSSDSKPVNVMVYPPI